MTWLHFSRDRRRAAGSNEPPEALVVLLYDVQSGAAVPSVVAPRWSAAVPGTGFFALAPLQDCARDFDNPATARLEALLHDQLQSHHLDSSRLVLAGFGLGARLALQLWLDRAWSCAGILAIGTSLNMQFPRVLRVDCKVRLIDCAGPAHANPGGLQTMIARFDARGIDARGSALAESPLSDAAIRLGTSYLVELVATAQRGNRFHVERTKDHA